MDWIMFFLFVCSVPVMTLSKSDMPNPFLDLLSILGKVNFFHLPGCEDVLPRVLDYLCQNDLKQFEMYIEQHAHGVTKTVVENTGKRACQNEIDKQKRNATVDVTKNTSNWYLNYIEQRQQSPFFASNHVIQALVESKIKPKINTYLQRYRSLRFGPQVPKCFNIFAGDGLYDNAEPFVAGHAGWMYYTPGSSGHSIATSSKTKDEMTTGKHYISFNFQDLGTRDEIEVQIGVMRRIKLKHWEVTILPEFKEECCLRNGQLRSMLRRMRRQTASLLNYSLGRRTDPGRVDCCLFNPRGIWTETPPHPAGPIRRRATSNARLSTHKWDQNLFTTSTKNLGVAYNTDTLDYEAGLLLDADTGTLDYYHKGMLVKTLTDGLAGGYVWVMQLQCKGSERHTEIKTSTY